MRPPRKTATRNYTLNGFYVLSVIFYNHVMSINADLMQKKAQGRALTNFNLQNFKFLHQNFKFLHQNFKLISGSLYEISEREQPLGQNRGSLVQQTPFKRL